MLAKEEKESVKVVGEENPPPQRFQRKVRGGGRLRLRPEVVWATAGAAVFLQVRCGNSAGSGQLARHRSSISTQITAFLPAHEIYGPAGSTLRAGGGVVSTHTHK